MPSGVEVANAYVSLAISGKDVTPGVKKALGGLDGEASTAGKRVGSRMSESMKSSLKVGAGLALGAAFAGASKLIGDSIGAAADLQQSIGAVESIFGKSAAQMSAWSKSAAQSVGLTRNEFNELGSLIGAQLKNGGTAMDALAPKTKQLIGLGADLSSMFGGTTREAVEALSSALKGERDPIERYGVSLSQSKIDAEAAALGYKKVGGALSSQAQQAATLSLVMKQTSDAHGNFAKESGTLSGQQQRLSAQWADMKAQLGTALLPALTSLASTINGRVLPAISSTAAFVKNNQTALKALGATVAVVGAALLVFGAVAKAQAAGGLALYVMQTNIAGKATRAFAGAQAVMNAVMALNPFVLVIAGLALLGAALVLAYKKSSTFRAVVQGAFSGVRTAIGWVIGAAANLMGTFARMLRGLSKVPGFGWAKGAANAMDNAAGTARRLADNIRGIQSRSVTVTTTYRYIETGKPSKSQSLIMNGAVSGARAAGGPVAGGRTYLVGEEGPELFTPNTSGRITANHDLRAASGSAVAGMGAGGRMTLVVDGHEFSAYVDSRADGRVGAARASAARRTRARLEVL